LHEPQSKAQRHKSSKEHKNRTKALKSTSSKEHKLKSTKNRTKALKSTSLKAQNQNKALKSTKARKAKTNQALKSTKTSIRERKIPEKGEQKHIMYNNTKNNHQEQKNQQIIQSNITAFSAFWLRSSGSRLH